MSAILDDERWWVAATGCAFGVLGVLLVYLGNPLDTGICVSCFIENIVGALGWHGNLRMSYLRPEIIGFLLGSFVFAQAGGEFRVQGGGSALVRCYLGVLMVIGSAVFLGCPLKLIYRIAAGDIPAILVFAGLVAGVFCGLIFVRRGFVMGRSRPQSPTGGYLFISFFLLLYLALVFNLPFIRQATYGAGSYYAPLPFALFVGLLIGGLAQRSRFCVTGGLVNFFVARDYTLLIGLLIFFLAAVATSVATGQFVVNIAGRVGTHTDYLWSFGAMFMVGMAAVFAGGCPFRQLIVAGEGNLDAGMTVVGMFIGGALVQNWGLVSSVEGASSAGKQAVLAGLISLLLLGLHHRFVKE